jgi:multicomponent Na+:H+ antiporter subunit D
MKDQLPALIIIIPLSIATLAPLIAFFSSKLLRGVVICGLFATNFCSIGILMRVLNEGTWRYRFGGWEPPWGIEYFIDSLGAVMATLISFISFFVIIYSKHFLKDETWFKKGITYSLMCLVTLGLTGMVITGDAFNLYVFLEIASLATYALIALGGPRAAFAAFRYVIIGTVGASFYLMSIGYIYAVTGTLNMADMSQRIQPLTDTPAFFAIVVMMILGIGIKMGLFPLHGWLPDSYTCAPPPATALISGVMTKVSAYVIFRFFYFVFDPADSAVHMALEVLGWIAAVGIIVGSIMAIAQSDFRRMLAYSSVAQIGYIVLGLAIGNTFALIGAVLHILNHAFMKSCLFFIAGGVKWKTGEHLIDKFTGFSKSMPISMGALLITAFSMVGLPPTAGFFSKWYLVLGALEADMWIYIVVIIVSSLLNAIYFFRVIEQAFMKKQGKEANGETCLVEIEEKKCRLELPATMLIPIIVLGLGVLAVGILNGPIVEQILQYSVLGGGAYGL